MRSSSVIRLQIETALAERIPSALTPVPKMLRPVAATGVESLDELLKGGLLVGAITELVGPECSGRTSVALSFLARMTQASKVCAWIDVANSFDPVSAAAAGLDLERLLWVRCGVTQTIGQGPRRNFALPDKHLVPPATKKGLHGGGFGPHPRSEVNGLSEAVSGFVRPETIAPRCAEPQSRVRPKQETFEASYQVAAVAAVRIPFPSKPWPRIEQALRTTDLLLQGGGFSAVVLDMGSIAPEFVSRVPLATWHRYRPSSQRPQPSIFLLTHHPLPTTSAAFLLR